MSTTSAAEVTTYELFAHNGRRVRTATQVTFATGETIRFMERVSKREAVRQAEMHRGR